jgi:hypothetical protein
MPEARMVPAKSSDLSSEDFEFMPSSAYELIDWLSERYPARPIRKGQSLEDAHREAGARELIDRLILQRSEEMDRAQSVDLGTKRRRRGKSVS